MTKIVQILFLSVLSVAIIGCVGSVDQGLKTDPSLKKSTPTSTSTEPSSSGGGGVSAGSFNGCVSATGLDTQRISLIYEFPLGYEEVFIHRNGIQVYTSRDKTRNTFVDTSLQEGQTYTYECGAIDSSGKLYIGSNVLEAGTLVVNPPQFNGITSSVLFNSNTAVLTWGAPFGGATVDHYKIYYNPGNVLDWGLAAKETTANINRAIQITNLGDEVPYSFGVRACTATNVCDANVAISNLTLPDTGAPSTIGASEINIVNGNLVISAPWSHEQGAVKRRKIYQRIGAVGGTNIADYTLLRTEVIADADLGNPNTALLVANPLTSTNYHFIVQDEDPSFNQNTNTSVVSIITTDLDAPAFPGITGLANSTPADTILRASFNAIASEPADPNGASFYLFYTTSADLPTVPADPCTSGTLKATVSASGHTSGNNVDYDITGLVSRKNYRVCVKAKDAAGNISNTVNSLSAVTKDIIAPLFDGIQSASYVNALSKIAVTWNPSLSSDVLEYRIRVWNAADPGNVTTMTRSHSTYPGGFSFGTDEFPMSTGDIIHVVVNACDNAAPTYNTTANCSAYADSSSIVITLPDIDPPTDFLGINGTAACTPESNGCKKISWSAPLGGWTGYLGFKIYSTAADNSLTWLKDCVCSGNDCVANPLTSCDVSGLGVGQTYNFYVRAYDQAGNLSAAVNPWLNKMSGKTGDVTAPTFNAGLTLSNQSDGNHNSWTQGTDNQVSSAIEAGNVITYELYRKVNASFTPASITSKLPDGLLVYSGTNLSYIDPSSGLSTGSTYYYTMCAKDSSNNKTCDGDIKNIFVPDNDPPPGFSGITAAGACAVAANGCLKASWNPPASWSDYRGFKVYSVAFDNSLTLLKTCSCSAAGCPEHPLSCEVTGLDAGRNYDLFVTAYDSAGNLTSQTNAYLFRRTAKSGDVSSPVFNSGFTASWQASPVGSVLNWNQATDNQYATGNFIGYTVYRKQGATFTGASLTANAPDGSPIISTTSNSYLDPGSGLTEGQTYYYTVCAYDSATPANIKCDGVVQSLTAPDVSPPPGFSGIQSASTCTPNANGCARVTWLAPASWADYAGFEIYTVASDDSLTFIKNCACTANNCSANNMTYCETTIADAGRTTNFYVRAYDLLGNKTAVISPYSNRRTVKTGDVTPPSFTSFLNAAYQASPAGNMVSWSTAFTSDNQYFEMANTVTYKVYRKVGSTFTPLTVTNGTPDGTLINTSTSSSYLDPAAQLSGGQTHYYIVCAVDAANNSYCDNNIKSVSIADVTPPTISNLTVDTPITSRGTNYTLSWTLSDNSTPNGSIMVSIRRKASSVLNDYPSVINDPVISSGNGLTTFTDNYNPAPEFVKYVNYSITARDAAGNESAAATISVKIASATITDANYNEYQNTDWVLEQGSVVTIQTNNQITINGLTMNGNSQITHTGCSSTGCYKVDLKILGNATIGALASINVKGKGYYTNMTCSPLGYNNAAVAAAAYAGGSHGGTGGAGGAVPYGSVKDPRSHGGRGTSCGTPGGGLVILDVAGILTIDGTINANAGDTSGWHVSGSAGGAINLAADQIVNTDGTVTISAVGGTGASDYYYVGGGGGGRVALKYNTITGITPTNINHINVSGGTPGTYGGKYGSPGTIYYKSGTDLDGHVYSSSSYNAPDGYTGLALSAGTYNYFDSITAGTNSRIYQELNTYSIDVDILNSSGGAFYTPTNSAAGVGNWLIYGGGNINLGTTLIEY